VPAKANDIRATSGHPYPIEAPPTLQNPKWNDVIPPARMQIIDSEIA
jgi:hypothetical protein